MSLSPIPPVQCLLTFEALARLRHAGRTAEELCVTTSAVSHRMRQLESFLGCRLFERGDFSLTEAGRAYLPQVRAGLAAFRQFPVASSPGRSTRLRVAVTPTFSRQFLMPRLELFHDAYPEIELTLQVSIPLLDVTGEKADLEVRYGPGGYTDVDYRLLQQDRVVPVCSPRYLHETGPLADLDTVAGLARVRLLRSPLEPWSSWFHACGLALAEPEAGAQFNDLGLLYDAAASSLGVALGRLALADAWLDSGRLVRLSPRSVPSPYHHFICWRAGALERWECAAFADWLQQVLGAVP